MPIASSLLNKPRLVKKLKDFYDYVNQLAAVSAIQRRPGTGTLFMRGISDGGNGNSRNVNLK